MEKKFDVEQIKKHLQEKEQSEKNELEKTREMVLKTVITSIQKLFNQSETEVYIVGSLIKPYKFSSNSDVDIVLKNFKGDRFDVWTQLEGMIKRNVKMIVFEHCHFQDHFIKEGLKVL